MPEAAAAAGVVAGAEVEGSAAEVLVVAEVVGIAAVTAVVMAAVLVRRHGRHRVPRRRR